MPKSCFNRPDCEEIHTSLSMASIRLASSGSVRKSETRKIPSSGKDDGIVADLGMVRTLRVRLVHVHSDGLPASIAVDIDGVRLKVVDGLLLARLAEVARTDAFAGARGSVHSEEMNED